jgi:nucleoside-diphosphate-sugar epimerase
VERALVTGATGFTGSALCEHLVERGDSVTALVRATSDVSRLETLGVEVWTAELTDADSVASGLPDVDVVYHLAAAYRTEHADRDVFYRVNVEGTRNLLAASVDGGRPRFVHCSTVGVQGEIEDPPATEEAPLRPGDHYQSSKLEGERLALEFADRLPVRVVRPVGIYGPGDMRFLKLFRGIARRRFVLIGDGSVLYHLTHVSDLVRGIVLAGESEDAVGEAFTLCGPTWTTVARLVELVAEAVGRPAPRLHIPFTPVYAAAVVCEEVCRVLGVAPPLYRRRLDFFSKDRAFDGGKARRILGFEPRVALEDGLRETAAWYAREGLL